MVTCVSIAQRRGKNRSRLEHRIVVFNETEKRIERRARKSFPTRNI